MHATPKLRLVASQPLAPARPRDSLVERAIALLRAELRAPWTVTTLARRLGVSRPVLARRFRAATGTSPMRHLTALRMERAAALLADRSLGLAAVSGQVGYSSEFAFNRAFKRHHGLAPGGYRRASFTLRAAA